MQKYNLIYMFNIQHFNYKKMSKSKLVLLSIFMLTFMLSLAFSNDLRAQTPYTWDDYGLKFSVPAGFVEIENTGDKFEAKCEKSKIFLFGLYPIADENVTKQNLIDVLKDTAKESGMVVKEAKEIKFNGFEGVYAEGTVQGTPTFIACMLDPNGDLNFIVTVLHQNVNGAVGLVKSIQKM